MITAIELQRGLETNSKWVERAIVVLYQRQTADEQATQSTKVHNGRGFTACDARRGSYMAKWILSGKSLNGEWLEKARKMAKKYIRQLLEEAVKKDREQKGYRSDLIMEMAERLGISLEKLTILECKPEDVCGIPQMEPEFYAGKSPR